MSRYKAIPLAVPLRHVSLIKLFFVIIGLQRNANREAKNDILLLHLDYQKPGQGRTFAQRWHDVGASKHSGCQALNKRKFFSNSWTTRHFPSCKNQISTMSKDTVLSGVRNTLTQIKVPHSASELFVKRTSLTMILNNSTGVASVNQSKIASVLGIHQRNIAAATSRLENKDEDEVLPLSACERQLPRGTIITNDTRDLAYAF